MSRRFAGSLVLLVVLAVAVCPLTAQPLPPPGTTATTSATEQAGSCLVGPGLGATLLLPYFEVDLSSPAGVNTLISINNGWQDPALVRLILWTDWAIPSLAFDLYLLGDDIQTISIRDLLNGFVPSTGAGADLTGFEFCDTLPPYHDNPALGTLQIDQLVAAHTGVPGPLNSDCASETFGDGIARGYATVDVVDECSGLEAYNPIFTPVNTDYPYFADGGSGKGIAVTENRLWGDVAYVDNHNAAAQGNELIAIWADPQRFAGSGSRYTFYGRYSDWDGRDDRVPLPTRWQQRFLNGGPFAGGASLIVWRDTGSPTVATIPCGAVPGWWPLTSSASAMDEQAGGTLSLPDETFNLATQRVAVDSLALPQTSGRIELSTPARQSWVETTLAAAGLYSATFNGAPTAVLCTDSPP